jgi:signal transduction histidine kinase
VQPSLALAQAPAGSDPAADPRVEREQVATVYATLPSATAADVLLSVLVAGSYYVLQGGKASALVWLGLHVAQTLRYPVLGAYFKDTGAAERSGHWSRVAVRELAINSAVWGLAPWMLLPQGNAQLTALLMLIILTLASAGMLSVASIRGAIFAYAIPMTVGLATALAWYGPGLEKVLAGLCLLYLAVVIRFALRQHALLTSALVGRFAKEALAEQLARQAEVARRTSEEKTRFFASASHDLRQPLHAIGLFGAVLEKELKGSAHHASAARLMRGVQALGRSLDTMLDVSRLDGGVVVAEPRAVPVNHVFRSLQSLFEQRAEEKGLHLRLRASPLAVRTDPDLLGRLLANVVENAIKYTHEGGVLVNARSRGEAVWIECYDTGIGIPPDQLPRIYEEFYQVDNPGRDRSRGLGIGLAIVRRLANLLGHPIEMASRPGRGSRFRVIVAAAHPQEDTATIGRVVSDAPVAPHADLPGRILVLDDEADIGEAVTALLAVHGVECTHVMDESQARLSLHEAEASGAPFEALICDYRLAEGADGLDAAMRLRAQADSALPVLLITGETSPQRLQRVRESGVPVLFKPATEAVLVQALAVLKQRIAP